MSTRTQYEADLAALKGSLAKMGRLSADAVEDALEALCTADAEEAKGIIKGDKMCIRDSPACVRWPTASGRRRGACRLPHG